MGTRRVLTFVTAFLGFLSALSQSFTGTVLDNENLEPIQLAEIYFIDLKTGITTDQNGIFTVEHVTLRNIHIQITSLGYKTIDHLINLDSTNEFTFYLTRGHYNLKEVVVSVPAGKLQGENIVSVEHLKLRQLLKTAALTLAQTITNIPGVEQTSTGPGIGKPVIRGLSGNRIVTYSQGIRIENQQWGDEHGLGIGEVGIESVEVIKGPASLLYGSDALGGVLYFVDERYARQNSFEGFATSRFHTNTIGTTNNAGVKVSKEKFRLNLFGGHSSQTDYQIPDSDRVLNTRFNERNIKGSLGFNAKNLISNIRYSYLQNNFGITEKAVYTKSTQRRLALPFQTIDNHNITIENTAYTNNSKLNLTLGYTNNYRKEFEDDRLMHALGLKLKTFTYNIRWNSPMYKSRFNLIIGSQGMDQTNENNGEEILIPDARTHDIGGFILANLFLKHFQLQSGIRTDYRLIDTKKMLTDEVNFPAFNNSFHGISFSSGLLYKSERMNLRTNISSGYRAPTTSELLSDGIHEGTNRYEKGNIELDNEHAIQIDFSFDYQDEHFNFLINPFYNFIKDYIFISPTEMIVDNSPVFEYLQRNARLYGGELGLHYHPHGVHWLHLESNFSTVFAEDENDNTLPLIPQTKINTTVSAEILQRGKVRINNIFLQSIYKFKQNRIGFFEMSTNAYNLLNMGLNFEIETSSNPIELSAGVNNLLNTRYIDHLSRFRRLEIPNQGLDLYFGIKLKLDKKIGAESP